MRCGYPLIGLRGQTLAAVVDCCALSNVSASHNVLHKSIHRYSPVPVPAGTMIVKTTTENATLVGCSVQPDSTALLHAGGDGPHLLFIAP